MSPRSARVRGEVGLGDTNRRDARWGGLPWDEGRRSVLVGSVCAWGMVGPWAVARGWVTGDPLSAKGGARGFCYVAGGDVMAVDSLSAGAATVCRPRRRRKVGGDSSTSGQEATKRRTRGTYDDDRRRGFEQGPAPRRRRRRRRRARAAQVPGRPAKVQADVAGWGIEDGNVRDESSPAGDSPLADPMRTRTRYPGRGGRRFAVTGAWTASVLHPALLHGPLAADPGAPGGGCDVVRRCTGDGYHPIGPMGKIIQLCRARGARGDRDELDGGGGGVRGRGAGWGPHTTSEPG